MAVTSTSYSFAGLCMLCSEATIAWCDFLDATLLTCLLCEFESDKI